MAHEDEKQVAAPPTEDDVHIEESISTSEIQKASSKTQHVSVGGTKTHIFEQNKSIQTIPDIDPTTSHEAVSKPQSTGDNVKDYSSFSTRDKRFIVFMATIAAVFSPFTAQIYFPALNAIAKDLHVTNSKVNLTVTSYMVVLSSTSDRCVLIGRIDTASHSPSLHRRLLRYRRSPPCVHTLLRHLHHSRCRPRHPERLRGPARPPHGPICRVQRDRSARQRGRR